MKGEVEEEEEGEGRGRGRRRKGRKDVGMEAISSSLGEVQRCPYICILTAPPAGSLE